MSAVVDFRDGETYDRALVKGARAAVREVLKVRKGESVMIFTNPNSEVRQISMAVFDAVLEAGASPLLMFQQEKGQFDFAEEGLIKAMAAEPDVVISISSDRLGKDRFGMKHGYKGAKRRYDHYFDVLFEGKKSRSFWSPGVTVDMFTRTVPIDYARMRTDCKRIIKILAGAERVRVTAPGGTDFDVGIKGRKGKADNGDFSKPGLGGNLPAGEVYISPALGASNGTIAFDGSIVVDKGEIVIREPIVAEVEGGYIRSISGGEEAARLEKTVRDAEKKARKMGASGDLKRSVAEKYAKNAWSIGELGIGLNRSAQIVSIMLEDEKVYGTCHFAVGSNYDGDAESLIHLDGLVKRPTITAVSKGGKETVIMSAGRLVWDQPNV
jgi:leucyl aminopeptidase (aminopeptidase T)